MTDLKLCKKFNDGKYNHKVLELNQNLVLLNDLLRRFAEVGVNITTTFYKQLLHSPNEVFNDYLGDEALRKYWYGGCKLPRSKNGKERCKINLLRLKCNNTSALIKFYHICLYLKDTFETLYIIKEGTAVKTDDAELHIMQQCMEFAPTHEETDDEKVIKLLKEAKEEMCSNPLPHLKS